VGRSGRVARLSCSGVIREASIEDAAAGAWLRSVVNPEIVTSPAAYAYRMRTVPPEARRQWWCAEVEGRIVGWATSGLIVETTEPGVAQLDVDVHPDHRLAGVGSLLLTAAETHIRTMGARKAFVWGRGDDATAAFAERHGFNHSSSSQMLVLDPRTVEPPDVPDGVEVRPFAAFADDPRQLYDVDSVAMLDEPNEVMFDAIDYDVWRERWWDHPLVDMDASMATVVEDRAVALTWLHSDRERGRASNNGTGTLPAYRGRGLALIAKRASLARVAGLGVTTVYTGNDETNAPMLAINRRLGYRACSTMSTWTKVYVTSEPSA
jgi:GNAT superfamily N-acetyltransferase